MNILFFIGNGFDLNLGMKTRYADFYKYYKTIDSNSEYVNKLKSSISEDLENWSDLELALGEYTEKMNSQEDFDIAYEDIGEKLSDYLEKEEIKFEFNKLDVKKFYDYLAFPEKSLHQSDQNKITSFKSKWKNQQWNVNLVTFNYTRTLEKLIGDKHRQIQIGTHHNNPIILQSIEHIHGYTNDRRIMGVNDTSQIKNKTFHENQNILEALVKPLCNQAQRHTIDELCVRQVTEANLLCVFGSSIGETDNMWWALMGDQLKKDCNLIIFQRSTDIDPTIGYKKNRIERELKDRFLSRTNLTEEQIEQVGHKIYIGLNTNMFNLI